MAHDRLSLDEKYEVPVVFEGEKIGTATVGPGQEIHATIEFSEDANRLKEILFYGVADSLSIMPTHLQEEA